MIFHLKADCTFEAANIDDAFAVLVQHFAGLSEDLDELPELLLSGRIEIKPEGAKATIDTEAEIEARAQESATGEEDREGKKHD